MRKRLKRETSVIPLSAKAKLWWGLWVAWIARHVGSSPLQGAQTKRAQPAMWGSFSAEVQRDAFGLYYPQISCGFSGKFGTSHRNKLRNAFFFSNWCFACFSEFVHSSFLPLQLSNHSDILHWGFWGSIECANLVIYEIALLIKYTYKTMSKV